MHVDIMFQFEHQRKKLFILNNRVSGFALKSVWPSATFIQFEDVVYSFTLHKYHMEWTIFFFSISPLGISISFVDLTHASSEDSYFGIFVVVWYKRKRWWMHTKWSFSLHISRIEGKLCKLCSHSPRNSNATSQFGYMYHKCNAGGNM